MKIQNSDEKSRVDPITWMNLLFIFIVLFLHHVNYTQDYLWAMSHRLINPYEAGIDQVLQKFSVGGFLFLSGYKLALSKREESAQAFLLNRFLRIYPLYFLAVVLFSFTVYPHITGEMPTLGNFAIHALALQSWLPNFHQSNYLTIWFVSNLFFCYLIFLMLRRSLSDTKRFLLVVAMTVAAINLVKLIFLNRYGVDVFSGHFDTYFLFFALGMLSSQLQGQIVQFCQRKSLIIPIVSIICAIALTSSILFLQKNTVVFYILERVLIVGFTIPTYWILLQKLQGSFLPRKIAATLKHISVASLCVFLFHRPIWTMMYALIPEKSWPQSMFILGIGIPVIFLVSYQVQYFYGSQVLRKVLKRFQSLQA